MNAQMQLPNTALHNFGYDVHFKPPAPDGNDTHTSTGLRLKTSMRIPAEEEGQVHLGLVHSLM
jgi:hypothetical protein